MFPAIYSRDITDVSALHAARLIRCVHCNQTPPVRRKSPCGGRTADHIQLRTQRNNSIVLPVVTTAAATAKYRRTARRAYGFTRTSNGETPLHTVPQISPIFSTDMKSLYIIIDHISIELEEFYSSISHFYAYFFVFCYLDA